jgi:predicted alpha/beta-hydrolase family hydrolase
MIFVNNLSNTLFIFAHGAGAGMDSDFILELSKLLELKGVEVRRFEFPYMQKIRAEGKRRPPDRMPKLLVAYEEIVRSIKGNRKVYIGGKSMGGRVASLLAAEQGKELAIRGVICLGFPFHPPNKPENYRGEHLVDIDIPTLIVQGERDTFGTKNEVADFCFSDSVDIEFLADGDHSFKPRVKSGVTLDENLVNCSEFIHEFIERTTGIYSQ